jgi:hypothetical protein
MEMGNDPSETIGPFGMTREIMLEEQIIIRVRCGHDYPPEQVERKL